MAPGPGEVRRAEEALAWVLWALFTYAEEVGLNRPPFWRGSGKQGGGGPEDPPPPGLFRRIFCRA
ncbi:MAG: hypothetical protein H5T61_07345 [Thermoflexales bacterium]|nr:hypothetical protein [Thermoflexales bacterium]